MTWAASQESQKQSETMRKTATRVEGGSKREGPQGEALISNKNRTFRTLPLENMRIYIINDEHIKKKYPVVHAVFSEERPGYAYFLRMKERIKRRALQKESA